MKTIKILFRNAALTAVIIMMILTFTGARYYGAYSTEGEGGGMGWFSHEQAEYVQSLTDAGMDPYEITAQMIADGMLKVSDDFQLTTPDGYTGDAESILNAARSAQTQPQQSQSVPESTTDNASTTQKTPAKVYSHDFETITDEARENFIHFSKDGVPESMYLNINSESIDNALTGKELNATTSGNETGTVNFIDGDKNTVYSWIFEAGKWTSDDEFSLDLATKVEDYDVEDLSAQKLSVQDISLPTGNEVTLKAAVSYDDETEIGLYTLDAEGKYNKIDTVVVEDGFITITYKDELVSYIISSDDLTTLNKEEEIVEEAQEETGSEPEQAKEVSEPVEVVEEVAEPEVAEEPVQEVPAKKSLPVAAIIGIIVVVLAGLAGIFAYIRKKR